MKPMSHFTFIVFDQHTGRLLGHGPDAALARAFARTFSVSRSILIIPAGNA
jgi:hypothetical protein